jgi:hypothetical protein
MESTFCFKFATIYDTIFTLNFREIRISEQSRYYVQKHQIRKQTHSDYKLKLNQIHPCRTSTRPFRMPTCSKSTTAALQRESVQKTRPMFTIDDQQKPRYGVTQVHNHSRPRLSQEYCYQSASHVKLSDVILGDQGGRRESLTRCLMVEPLSSSRISRKWVSQ